MKKITLKLYCFTELKREAKEKALTTYRDLNLNFDWWDDVYEDFIELCSCIGITVDKQSIKFSGFYSQGDGSRFSAKADLTELATAIESEAWKDHAPQQEFDFPRIKTDRRVMALLAKGTLPGEPQIIARHRQYGVVVDLGAYAINENGKTHNLIFEELDNLETGLRKVAEILNCHLYRSLENQYEFLTSDTAIKDSLLSNEYLFTADGRSANHLLELTKSNA